MQKLAQIHCAMFDLDGTLVESAPDIAISLNLMLQEFNLPACDLLQVRDWMGNGANRLIKRALTQKVDGEPEENLFFDAREAFRNHYDKNLCKESYLFPGAIQGVQELHAKGIKLACVTNKPRRFTLPLMDKMQLSNYFSNLICGDDLTVKKPDPAPLHLVLKEFGLKPKNAIVVGDSEADIHAAKAAQIASFCVSYGYHQGKGVDALGADYIIHSITEVPQYLQ